MYRCPSQMRTVREASAKRRDRSSSCRTEPGTSTERSGERAAGGVLFFSSFTNFTKFIVVLFNYFFFHLDHNPGVSYSLVFLLVT